MKKHTIEIKIEVTDEQIEDIMTSALTGCIYWADNAYIVVARGEEAPDMYNSAAITHGKVLRIHDAETDKWHRLTLTKFLKGLKLCPAFDYENYDALDAEQVLQMALFGEVVYG